MQSEKKQSLDAPTVNKSLTVASDVKESLTTDPVSNRYKFADSCFACGSLPCDQTENPWQSPPWVVHFDMAHFPKFLIDGRDPDNPDMFLGYRVSRQSLTTGQGGRLAFHRSHFAEDLPA